MCVAFVALVAAGLVMTIETISLHIPLFSLLLHPWMDGCIDERGLNDWMNQMNEQMKNEWTNKRQMCWNNTHRETSRSLLLSAFLLSEAECFCWDQSSRKQDLSQDTWGGVEREGKQEAEGKLILRKERKACCYLIALSLIGCMVLTQVSLIWDNNALWRKKCLWHELQLCSI